MALEHYASAIRLALLQMTLYSYCIATCAVLYSTTAHVKQLEGPVILLVVTVLCRA